MWSNCSRKLRCSGFGLNSYLSSGKSSAMVISRRPTSFHCSRTACDGLDAGLGGSFFAASCADMHNIATPIANTTPHNLTRFFMACFLRFVPFELGTPLPTHRPPEGFPFSAKLRTLSFGPGSSYASKVQPVIRIPRSPHVKIVFCSWENDCEWARTASCRHHPRHFRGALPFATVLAPLSLADHLPLGPPVASPGTPVNVLDSSLFDGFHADSCPLHGALGTDPPEFLDCRADRAVVLQRAFCLSFSEDSPWVGACLALVP